MSQRANTLPMFEPKYWSPAQYLAEYYSAVEPDELATIRFLVERFARLSHIPRLLEFGCGPTLHHIFPAVPSCDEIHMADYLPANLDAIRGWLVNDPSAHAWDEFIRYALECEGKTTTTAGQVAERANRTRALVEKLIEADAGDPDPLGPTARGSYPVVLSCYCADSATGDKEVWARYLSNIASLVAPGGTFIIAALRNARFFTVGPNRFPSANIDESDLQSVLASHFDPLPIEVNVVDVPEHSSQGYSSILLAVARKPASK